MGIQGHTGECNAIIPGTSLNIKLETLSWVKMDIGKKVRPHIATADWPGTFDWETAPQPKLSSQLPLVIAIMSG